MNQETVENTGKAPSCSAPRLDRGRTEVPRARGRPEREGAAPQLPRQAPEAASRGEAAG